MKRVVTVTLLMLAAPTYAQDSVKIREVSEGNYVATLVSQNGLPPEEAQGRLMPAAANTCKNSSATLGHYDFKSSKNISDTSGTSDLFEFNQTFTCTVEQSEISGQVAPTVISDSEKERLAQLVTRQTRQLVDFPNEGVLRTLHSQFSKNLTTMLPRQEWIEQQVLLRKNSGALRDEPKFNVTTYVDPQNSPEPGLYLAVDFQVSYERAPFRCGYVMWLFDQQSNLSLLRIEDGTIYDKDAAAMTPDELAQTKETFRCFAP